MGTSLLALVLGYCLDLCIGDPHWLPHPIRWIGWLIGKTEKVVRKCFPNSARGLFWGGVCLAFVVMGFSTAIPWLVLWLAGKVAWWLQFLLEILMCYQILATKALWVESMKVYHQLAAGNLPGARKAVGMIVGRDTQQLSPEGVAKAAVETVAENTSDGVICLLYTSGK